MKLIFLLFSLVVVSAQVPKHHKLNPVVGIPLRFRPYECFLPADVPPCVGDSEAVTIWRWDKWTNQCVEDVHRTSCIPTRNNFQSLYECIDIAEPVCRLNIN
ncbi:unnamed protein product [Diabrotica balteata]|uniref:Uncharacterized protein n=1 Tax=Diabrotica balteata TaxID=107213 RepID=A0A9N9T8P5_DIABA|nr:unnamed protein product [Diabrotica balteata]